MISVILCGGSGTRLWPVSRKYLPKQFVKIFDGESLFQKTVKRNMNYSDDIYIISNETQYFLALNQLDELTLPKHLKFKFFLETVGRNTAPAIGFASMDVGEDDILLVCPSDHLIENTDTYERCVIRAKELAQSDCLVTFGISPSYPETGYGYIHAKGENVIAFKEKPDAQTAASYVSSGEYLWNSGMFCFKAKAYLRNLKKYSEDIYQGVEKAYNNKQQISDNEYKIPYDYMMAIPDNSIDYAVMEKAENVKVVYGEFNWNDVGSFKSLHDISPKDLANNAVLSMYKDKSDKTIMINSHDNLIVTGRRHVSVVGEKNLVIVDTDDALLVANKDDSQRVKEVVNKLQEQNPELTVFHKTVLRPWGEYTVLESSVHFKVKKIQIKPGKRMPMEKHFHRKEHWIVVSGTGKAILDDEEFLLRQNESTSIEIGVSHSLENPGNINLVIIETQVGEYTDEDDSMHMGGDHKRLI